MGEMLADMPNSFATIAKVLDELKQHADIGPAREWVATVCDGHPYNLISKLLEGTLAYPTCNTTAEREEVNSMMNLGGEVCREKKM